MVAFELQYFNCPRGLFLLIGTLCASMASAFQAHIPDTNVANIEIYYEAMCPFCHSLLNESVRQIWEDKEMLARVNLTFYPFGNAQLLPQDMVSEGYQFWHEDQRFPMPLCQHGPSECLGNMIQTCAMETLQVQERYIPYLLCLSSYPSQYGVELTSYACGTKLGVNMSLIKECTQSSRGHQLMLSYGSISLRPELGRKYVPWVVINGKHHEDADHGDIVGVLCDELSPRPSSCQKTDSTLQYEDLRALPREVEHLNGEMTAGLRAFEPCLQDARPKRV